MISRWMLVLSFFRGRRCADPLCGEGPHTYRRWCLYHPPVDDD